MIIVSSSAFLKYFEKSWKAAGKLAGQFTGITPLTALNPRRWRTARLLINCEAGRCNFLRRVQEMRSLCLLSRRLFSRPHSTRTFMPKYPSARENSIHLSPLMASEGFAPAQEHRDHQPRACAKGRTPLYTGIWEASSTGIQHRSPGSDLWHNRTCLSP